MMDRQEQPNNQPLRVLVVGLTNLLGGLESVIMNYCEQLAGNNIHFDFLCRFPKCSVEDRIVKIGGSLYPITRRSKNPLKFYWQIHRFFREHAEAYDVIWDNECMLNDITPLLLAKHYGIPCRIFHSHNADNMDYSRKGRIREMLHQYHKKSVGRIATELWACSHQAARWALPEDVLEQHAYRIIQNAIPIERYRYNPEVRAAYRNKLGLEHTYVVGHVGHLRYEKNQSFLLDAFAGFHRQYPDTVLLFVGEGADLGLLQQKAETLKIAGSVRFLGRRNDVAQLLQAMDLFAMPSKYEGLGMAALEAQTSGLPCVLSDGLPQEVRFCDNVVFLSTENAQKWSEAMANIRKKNNIRIDGYTSARAAGYSIAQEAGYLEELWRSGKNHDSTTE